MQLKPVVLLQPYNTCRKYTRSGSVYPPLGLCQLAAVDIYDVMQVVDAEALSIQDEVIQDWLVKCSVKICCLTATSYSLGIIEEYAAFCSSHGIALIAGGPHPTLSPETTFEKCPHLKYIIRGEGELIINEVIRNILDGKPVNGLPGVCIRNGKDTIISKEILYVSDFSKIPFPKIENLPIKEYHCPDIISKPMTTFSIQRGCPNGCKFCSTSQMSGRKIRGWSVNQIIKELEFLFFDIGIREISFVDDVFTLNTTKTKNLCEQIISKGLKFDWFCNIRANQINHDIAKTMKKAGCHQVYIGFESGNQRMLDSVKKHETIEEMDKGSQILKDVGIDISAGFIIGLPGETDETIKETIEFANRIKPKRIQFTRFTPLVGSEFEYLIPTSNNGFHDAVLQDKTTEWIKLAYNSCKGTYWGKESI